MVAALCLGAGAAGHASGPPGVLTVAGRPFDPLSGPPPVVLVFARTDCPLSNRYAPELRRLHERFAAGGTRFYLVYPGGDEDAEAIRRHGQDFAFGFEALRDPGHALVRHTGVTVTPEVAVFARDGEGLRMVYRGRIDDRASALGRSRPAPTRRDLEEVLEALAAGEAPPTRATAAVGCFIPARP